MNGTLLEICPLHHDRALLQEAPEALAPSRYCLREWKEYIVRGVQDLMIPDGERDDLGGGVFRFRFENRIGRATLHFALAGGRVEDLPVEVLSAKCPTADEHLRFFGMLLRDLSRRAAGLPFTISAPTGVAVDESATTPTPLFVYYFFLQHDDELRAAIDTILAAPHRRLSDESRWMPIAQAATVDTEMLSQLVTHPEHLVEARQNTTFACAAALKGHLPAHVWQLVPRDSYDTPENRFVRAFLGMLLQAGQEVREQNWWQIVPRERQTRIAELVGYIAEVLRAGMFDEVGDMIVFPASSQVLLRREGYRELLMLWRLFQVARQPFFADLQEAIALRDVATLYEFWCFFRLAEELAQVFASSPMGKIVLTDRSGLVYDETRFDWAGQGSLVFNREFRSGTNFAIWSSDCDLTICTSAIVSWTKFWLSSPTQSNTGGLMGMADLVRRSTAQF